MKNIITYTCLFFSFFSLAFIPVDFGKKVKLEIELSDCEGVDSLYLYQFEGFGFAKVKSAVGKEGKYEFVLPKGNSKFYYLGAKPNQTKPILLGTESEVIVKGACSKIGNATITSSLNQAYEKLKLNMGKIKQETDLAVKEFQASQNDEGALAAAIAKMKQIDDKQLEVIHTYREIDPLLGEVAALNTYLSFPNNSEGYYSELDYFANEFFHFADFKSDYYKYNPWVYEAFKEYTRTLSSINLEADLHQSYLNDILKKIPSNSHVYQLALCGVVTALGERRHPSYSLFGKRLIKKYDKKHPELIAGLKQQILGASTLLPGAVAPDFSQKTPAGETMNLSDLRGKVVLVDFWASWCGPCRRENPNVKKVYEKYKDKGFAILGVSLDRNKASWEKAIEQDQLSWHHVSDLKGWKNEVAQLYKVSSIPHTFLLDQEGKIIASKLRAHTLEQALAQIFGE